MSQGLVQTALENAVGDILGTLGIPVEFENAKHSRTPGESWASTFYLPGKRSVETTGPSGVDRLEGVQQITLRYPLGTGTNQARLDADAIEAYFLAGRSFASGSQSVLITSSGRSKGTESSNWYLVYISIYWLALIQR